MSEKTNQVETARASLDLAFSVIGQIGFLTGGAVIGTVLIGILLDKVLGTRPLFTLLLLVASFPITFYFIRRIALNALSKSQSLSAAETSPLSVPAKEAHE